MSKAQLNAELKALLSRIYERGGTVKGRFNCRNGAEHPDWNEIVTEVKKAIAQRDRQ